MTEGEILEIKALLEQLETQLGAFNEPQKVARVEGENSAEAPLSSCGVFITALRRGAEGPEVKCLQEILNQDEETRLIETGPGSPGSETKFFGPLTENAVIRFQEKYAEEVLEPWDLTEGTGYVGKTTREKLNSLIP